VALCRGAINSPRDGYVKGGLKWGPKWAGPAGLGPFWPISRPPLLVMLPESSRAFSLLHVGPRRQFLRGLVEAPCPARFSIFYSDPHSFLPS
jgi:hypothetical protein